jgi:DNA end-binding protein Ku
MKLVDPEGRPLGRQYYCPKDEKTLSNSDLVRGFETDKGKMLVVTEEELESVAPELTRDIELRRFVHRDQIPASYYQRPYFLAPSSKSTKAYHLLAETMEGSGQAGIGSFVMRGHEYLAAIVSEDGLLRMATLRHADELRTPADVGLPKAKKVTARGAKPIEKAIDNLTREKLDMDELSDSYAGAVSRLVEKKEKKGEDVVNTGGADAVEGEPINADVLDLMKVLRERVSPKATVTTADGAPAPDTQSRSNVHHLDTRRKRGRAGSPHAKKRRRG